MVDFGLLEDRLEDGMGSLMNDYSAFMNGFACQFCVLLLIIRRNIYIIINTSFSNA